MKIIIKLEKGRHSPSWERLFRRRVASDPFLRNATIEYRYYNADFRMDFEISGTTHYRAVLNHIQSIRNRVDHDTNYMAGVPLDDTAIRHQQEKYADLNKNRGG